MTCIVVKRGEYANYDRLFRAFGDRLPVVWDRRRAARRPAADGEKNPRPYERRASLPASWEALGFVVTHSSGSKRPPRAPDTTGAAGDVAIPPSTRHPGRHRQRHLANYGCPSDEKITSCYIPWHDDPAADNKLTGSTKHDNNQVQYTTDSGIQLWRYSQGLGFHFKVS
jgi:hypothetical protein